MTKKLNLISAKEFRELGYLQELNRQFLHPLGLALSVTVDDRGVEEFGGIWDYREDEEGIVYGENITSLPKFKKNIEAIAEEQAKRKEARERILGYFIQE